MILQSLTDYYEALVGRGELSRSGWSKARISWALELGDEGQLSGILPLRYASEDGKRMIPKEIVLPAPVKRSSGVNANFLWDNSSYILGVDTKGKPERSRECFEAAKSLHLSILSSIEDPAAKAVCSFFQAWSPEDCDCSAVLQEYKEEVVTGDNITFFYAGRPVSEISVIQEAWENSYEAASSGDEQICLITGKKVIPELIHPAIKRVNGAQSSGAALVSFNAPSFCSFGKEQNGNAPVGKYAAFAYTSALNHLLENRDHVELIGNTSVVYWAKGADEQYQDLFSLLLDGTENQITNEDLNSVMDAITSGKRYDFEGLPLCPENDFYILGISPNAARLSVRFFYHSSFGELVCNIRKHYDDQKVVTDNRSKWDAIPLWKLLRETVNQKSKDDPLPQMSGDVLKSMITGGRYPETLMNQVLLRIRAEHGVTRGRAGIIKGYLLRNTENHPQKALIQEVATVALNEESNYTPYVLGRLFAVLEGIQQDANPGINATIKDRFFNSACATPAAVFPILLKLSNSHLKKMTAGKSVYWSKQVGVLTDKMGGEFPSHLSLQEQGSFILGYYHQTQKRFEKKTNDSKEVK